MQCPLSANCPQRLAYSLLFKVMEGDGRREPDPGLIEGKIMVEG